MIPLLRRPLDRRTFLRGLGGAAIALPLVEEMFLANALAATPAIESRLVTVFFGLGMRYEWQRGFSDSMQPLESLADKLSIFTTQLPGGPGGAHCTTSAAVFVGERPNTSTVARSASLDVLLRNARQSAGGTEPPILSSGLWWRNAAGNCVGGQATRTYRSDGTPIDPIHRPTDVFQRIVGALPEPPDPDPDPTPVEVDSETLRLQRADRSVLDAVMEQYRFYRGERSPLGAQSKVKLDIHFEHLRDIERRLPSGEAIIDENEPAPTDPPAQCEIAAALARDPELPNGVDYFSERADSYDTGRGAPDLTYDKIDELAHLHADLWVAALRCDAVRTGSLMFSSAGEHVQPIGTYEPVIGGVLDASANSHHDGLFHGAQHSMCRLYQHFAMRQIGYFLEQLDNEIEANGNSMLDNTAIVMGTEHGIYDGDDTGRRGHGTRDVFAAVAGRPDLFRGGFFNAGDDRNIPVARVYRAVLEAMGVPNTIG
ncbi:MAG: DUF1552 domain-containing protein, partial [Myxococcota bacterium]